MLQHLSIRNIVLIESLDLDLSAGLCVLTGETGAGKSILLDALGLALGARADTSLIRVGVKTASVSAAFTRVPPGLVHLLGEHGMDVSPDEAIVCRRVLHADKTTRAFLNDQPVTLQLLRAVSSQLIDVHGQFDALADGSDYRRSLDGFISRPDLFAHVRDAYHAWVSAREVVDLFEAQRSQGRHQLPFWQQSFKELSLAQLKSGEVDALERQRSEFGHLGKLVDGLKEVEQKFSGAGQILNNLLDVSRLLGRISQYSDAYQDPLRRVDQALLELQDIQLTLGEKRNSMLSSAQGEEAIEERLFTLRALARKNQCAVDDLAAIRDELEQKILAVEQGDDRAEELSHALARAREKFKAEAHALHQERCAAAGKITDLVNCELPALKLPDARFIIEIIPCSEEKWAAHGADEVMFKVATNVGTLPGAIGAIASGGERSRLLLALKLALAATAPDMAFVFDEVDSGIGGATAAAVGERLKRLSTGGRQVLVVTHSPQVAAHGDDHWHISKMTTADNNTKTVVRRLDTQARQEEIARMLSGADVTEEARAAAGQLMGISL